MTADDFRDLHDPAVKDRRYNWEAQGFPTGERP
jgi:hypothetical protein